MRISNAETGPKMTLDITSEEREVAKTVKKNFVNSLEKLEKAVRTITDIRDAISNERPSKEDLRQKYKGKLIRYRKKIKNSFNSFLTDVKENLENLSKISDPEMIKLREVLIAEVGELSDGAEAVMDLLDEVDREGFTKTLEKLAQQIEKRQKSIIDVIDSQFITHIDQDILGKMKLSNLRFRIKKRSRIIKQLI